MLRNVKLIGEEWSYPSKLHDALAPVHDRNLILAHKLFATMSSDEFKNGQKNNPSRLREGLERNRSVCCLA